jgi:hypothetical protein
LQGFGWSARQDGSTQILACLEQFFQSCPCVLDMRSYDLCCAFRILFFDHVNERPVLGVSGDG